MQPRRRFLPCDRIARSDRPRVGSALVSTAAQTTFAAVVAAVEFQQVEGIEEHLALGRAAKGSA